MHINDPKLPADEIDDETQGLSLLDDDEIADMNDDDLVDEDGGEDDDAEDDGDGDGNGAGSDGDDDDAATAAEDADGAGEKEDAARPQARGDDVAAEAAKVAAEAAAAAAAGEEGTPAAAGEGTDGGPAPIAAPARPYVAPAAAEQQIASIDKAIDELDQKYDDGELSRAEYRAEERKLRDQREDLVYQKRSAEDRISSFTEATVPSFLSDKPEYDPGSADRPPSLRYRMLDIAVREVQEEMIRTGKGDPLSADALRLAHEKVVAELGGVTQAPKPAAAAKPALPARKAMPPSLGTLPSANIESTTTDRFAAIDRLKGEAQEDAIAKMSEADQEAYLAWQG